MLGLFGILGATPIDFFFGRSDTYADFEGVLNALYFTIYRMFTVIHAYCVAMHVDTPQPFIICLIATISALYGALECSYRVTQGGTEEQSLVNKPVINMRYLAVLATYSALIFFVLIFSLSSMRDIHWNRCGIIVLLLLVPMVLEVVYEVQLPLFGLLEHSGIQQISRAASYYLGGIVFVISFQPVAIGRDGAVAV
jgi:hypothetical protein